MEAKYVDVQEAAALLGVPRKKVAALIKEGVLEARPSILDKRRKLIDRRAVEALLVQEGRSSPLQQLPHTGEELEQLMAGELKQMDAREWLAEAERIRVQARERRGKGKRT